MDNNKTIELENNDGKMPILKSERVGVPHSIANLVHELQDFECDYDERVLESIGKTVGFHSDDDKVYKLLGCLVENLTESVISNINHIHRKEIETISKKISEAEADSSSFE
jgi:hypothetical protein